MSTLSLFIFILGYYVYFLFVDRLKPLCCVCFSFLFFIRKKNVMGKIYILSSRLFNVHRNNLTFLSIGVKIQADGNVNCKPN